MNFGKKRFSILLTGLYLLGMIISAFTLLNFRNNLIYDLNILTISDAEIANPVFTQLYIVVGFTLILGLLSTYFSFKADADNVIFIEKKPEKKKKVENTATTASGEEERINLEELNQIINYKNAAQPEYLNRLLNLICKRLEASQGAFYIAEAADKARMVKLTASYAMNIPGSKEVIFEFGEGLVGQVARDQKMLYLDKIPEGYIKIVSGLGQAAPKYLLIMPVVDNNKLQGVIEIAGFVPVKNKDISTLEKFFPSLGKHLENRMPDKGDEHESVMEGAAEIDFATEKSKKKKPGKK